MSAPAGETLRTARIRVGALASPVIEAGTPDAREAVVFVHGNPGSRTDWEELVEATGALARSVALDMPGFGQADKPRDFSYQVSSYADFLQGALGELGIDRVHWWCTTSAAPSGCCGGCRTPTRGRA